jgi:hypothetical protein
MTISLHTIATQVAASLREIANGMRHDPSGAPKDWATDVEVRAGTLAAAVADENRAQEALAVTPRTWSLPPEPGPEVTAVRTAPTEDAPDGELWERWGTE